MRQAGFPAVIRNCNRRYLARVEIAGVLAAALACAGCSSGPSTVSHPLPETPKIEENRLHASRVNAAAPVPSDPAPSDVVLVSAERAADAEDSVVQHDAMPQFEIVSAADLAQLESEAIASNPELQRIQQEAAAAWQRARYIGRLPDPTVGLNVFAIPIETASGSQRGNLNVMQMIPWLSRLNAQEQRAAYEALSTQQEYQAARLRVIADVRSAYYKLYVLGKQIEINQANQQLLNSLIESATARVANGTATQGDVLLGTLELTRLQEQLVSDRQMVSSTMAELNRLRNRPAETLLDIPGQIEVRNPSWQHTELSDLARRRQPAIAAAQLTTQAASWGLEVARQERRPNFSVGSTWFFIGDNRPNSRIVAVGEDAWSIGASVSIPLSHGKYDAMEQEAVRKQFATQFAVSDVIRAYDSRLRDLLAQAQAADETASLYRDTILPQAVQTLEADQQSYAQNTVEFDRVIADVRNLLTLELGYHRALGQLATSVARIQEAVGGDLPPASVTPAPTPVPADEEISLQDTGNDLATLETAGHNEAEAAALLQLISHETHVSQHPLSPTSGTVDDYRPQRSTLAAGGTVLWGLRDCFAPATR